MIDFKIYLEMEDETTKETMRKFRKEFQLYERLFDLCQETMDYLYNKTKRKHPDSAKTATLLILPRIMQSMQSIRLLILKGYYYDAAVLERSLLESMGLCAYLSLDREEAENWGHGKNLKVATIKLLDYIPKLLDISDSNADAKPIYGKLCDYVHSNIKAISSFATPEEPPKITIDFTSNFDEDKVIEIAAYPMFVTLMLTEIFKNELTKNRKNRIAKFLKRFKEERVDSETKTKE